MFALAAAIVWLLTAPFIGVFDDPAPVLTHGRCHMWYRPDIEAWKAGPRERKW